MRKSGLQWPSCRLKDAPVMFVPSFMCGIKLLQARTGRLFHNRIFRSRTVAPIGTAFLAALPNLVPRGTGTARPAFHNGCERRFPPQAARQTRPHLRRFKAPVDIALHAEAFALEPDKAEIAERAPIGDIAFVQQSNRNT